MILAALGDIDGHLPALDAVLAAVDEAGVFTVLHTGNSVAGRPTDGAVLARLSAREVPAVLGRRDRLVVRYHKKAAALAKRLPADELNIVRRTYGNLASTELEALGSRPEARMLTVEGVHIALCHGALGNRKDVLAAETSLAKLQRQRELARADLVLAGGQAAPFFRMVGGTLFVGPGPLVAAPRVARYALINTDADPWLVDFAEAPFAPADTVD
ncbi:MAG: metallophosphoesterase family protein [Candidatus Hydrogenedentota bacterium]